MNNRSRGFRAGSVAWAVVLTVLAVVFIGTVLLPSTKRARIHVPRDSDAPPAWMDPSANPTTGPSTSPASNP